MRGSRAVAVTSLGLAVLVACAQSEEAAVGRGSGNHGGEAGNALGGAATAGTTASGAGGNPSNTNGGMLNAAGVGGTSSVGGSAAGSGGSGGSAGSVGNGGAGGTSSTGGKGGASGASGSVGASGSSGSGGVVISPGCSVPPIAAGSKPLIDDFEDRDGVVANFEQRSGGWFSYNDMSGGAQLPAGTTPLPVASDRGYSMNTSGSGFTSWGAGIGFVTHSGCPYDASAYHGFKFYLKGSVNSAGSLAVRVRTAATTPSGGGGTCTANCFDHYSVSVPVSATWAQVSVAWTDLKQAGFGTPSPFQANAIIGSNFEVGANQTFDLWLDDLNFF